MWLIVIARLLLPFSLESSVMDNWFQTITNNAWQNEVTITAPEMPSSIAEVEGQELNTEQADADRFALENWTFVFSEILQFVWVVWLFVASMLFIRKITIYQSFIKYVRAGCAEVVDIKYLEQLGHIIESNKLRGTVELSVNNLVSSPLIIGFFHPQIILPSICLTDTDFRNIMQHELTHYQRGDMFYKWLVQFTICLHWFNPLIFQIGDEINRVCELSCDEAVIKKLDNKKKRSYGDTLLNVVSATGTYKDSISSVTLNENKKLMKERLEEIMKFKGMDKWMLLVATAFSICLFAGGFALGTYMEKPNNLVTSEEALVFSNEGIPVMNAQNRALYESYISPISITGILYRNFSPEDISALLEDGSAGVLSLVEVLEKEKMQEYIQTGKVPATFVDEVLTKHFPLRVDTIRGACADIYDAESDTYLYTGGLGGGPAIPVVTGSMVQGNLTTIYFTWYVGDPAADTFRYIADCNGELIVDLSDGDFKYLSNKSIPLQ